VSKAISDWRVCSLCQRSGNEVGPTLDS
jgi:hypothetical protein